MRDELPVIAHADAEAFGRWLANRPVDDAGLWLKIAKKGRPVATVSHQQAIDIALCHGWIDGQINRFDDDYFVIRFTPRRARSKWSQINRQRALALAAEGRMTAPGLAEIERAQADGRWDAAYESMRGAAVPDDLARALAANPAILAVFEALDRHNRFAILHRVHDAKKPATRAARIAKYVEMLARGETLHPRSRREAADGE